MTRRALVLGNGPVPEGLAASIDAADCVMRFNRPTGPPERIGTRTDLLVLVNSGKGMQAWLADPDFLGSIYLTGAGRVLLPLHPAVIRAHHPRPNWLSRLKGRRADWTAAAIAALGSRGKEVSVLPAELHSEACRRLGIAGRGTYPSTGFLGLSYVLERFAPPEWRVEFAGFGFSGWKRHDWTAEKRWVEAIVAEGRLHPLTPRASPELSPPAA